MASPLLAGLVVLMIGDSHFTYQGTLVTTLQDLMVRQGANVTTYGGCGVPASVWARSGASTCGSSVRSQSGPIKVDVKTGAPVPSVTSLVASLHPGLLVICLGDTMAHYPEPSFPTDLVKADIDSLTAKVKEANVPCIWIGPGWGTEGGPFFKTFDRVKKMSDLLASNVAPCRYVNSLALSQPGEWPTADGMHYNVSGYQKWAFAIDDAVLKLVAH